MKHKLITLIVALALSSCVAPPPPTPLPPSVTFTQPPTRTPAPEPTSTPSFSATPLLSVTPIPIQSPTDANTQIAPEDVGVCPVENPNLQPDFSLDLPEDRTQFLTLEPSLDFLNRGGTTEALRTLFSQSHWAFYEGDLTGDKVPELGLGGMMRFDVIGCIGGKYVSLIYFGFPTTATPEIYTIKDLNLNGIPDVVFFTAMHCGFHACFETSVFEWDGTELRLLTKDPFFEHYSFLSMAGPYSLQVKDIDGNGTSELMLGGGIPFWSDYYEGLPWRGRTDTYMWDGEAYSLYRTEFSSPEYRFQAVQDGDEAVRWNELDTALDFYQRAIFDEDLKAWPSEQPAYELEKWMAGFGPETPTPAPTPTPDPAEYPNLAAYARYRIMLLHLQQGYESDAKVVYDTLHEKFPQGQPGHAYAEMAAIFWTAYQEEHSLKQACTEAIEYAVAHKTEILSYIGNIEGGGYEYSYHGWQSHDYTPEDICPFQ